MSTVIACDICNCIVGRVGSNRSTFIGVGENVVDACFECQTAVGEFLALRQEELRGDIITVESIPNIDLAKAYREKLAKEAEVVVEDESQS
jgi:hypothetical protein